MPNIPLKHIPGQVVKTRASLVSNPAELQRRYGSGWNTAILKSTVVSVENRVRRGNTMSSWFIVADWDVGGSIKSKELNSRSVKEVAAGNTTPNQAESIVAVQEFRRPDLNPNPNLHQDASFQTTTDSPPQQALITNPNNTTIPAEMGQNTNTKISQP